MTETQADAFVRDYEVVDHHPNDASGFSATLLRERASGAYTLAFRGTEYRPQRFGGDFERDGLRGADGELMAYGFAFGQLAAMERYYAALRSSAVLPPGAPLYVTGYSLGGHLATVFTELHPTEVRHAYVFNAPGRGSYTGAPGGVGQILDHFRAVRAGWQVDEPQAEDFGAQQNLYDGMREHRAAWQTAQAFHTVGLGNAGRGSALSAAAQARLTLVYGLADQNDELLIAGRGQAPADAQRVFIEDQPDITGWGGIAGLGGSVGETHSIVPLVDSLALMAAFERMDPSLGRESLEALLSAATREVAHGGLGRPGTAEGGSLETTLDALRLVVEGPAGFRRTGFDAGDGGFGDIENRERFHANLERLEAEVAARGGVRIEPLIERPAAELAAAAGQPGSRGLAYRHALVRGSAFAVLGAAAGDYAAFDRDRELSGLSAGYLTDRARWLERVLVENTDPEGFDGTSGRAETLSDLGTGRGFEGTGPGRVVFGTPAGERLVGGRGADRLYGRAGSDRLEGGAGSDQLEGGPGDDLLYGGDALLEEDRAVDLLRGGAGWDRYHAGSGDVIEDADGAGRVWLGGEALRGGVRDGEEYVSLDGQFVYRSVPGALEVVGKGGAPAGFPGLRVVGYRPGDLGIELREAGEALQRYAASPGADRLTVDGVQRLLTHRDEAGTVTVRWVRRTAEGLELRGRGGADLVSVQGIIAGLVVYGDEADGEASPGGDDFIVLQAGAPGTGPAATGAQAFGEGGDDYLGGTSGADRLDGGSGHDFLEGGAGDDLVAGGPGNDWLEGGEGADDLEAGAGNDRVMGGAGADRLAGGAGDDRLYGDAGGAAYFRDGAVWFWDGAHEEVNPPEGLDAVVVESADGWGADWLTGGAGADWLYGGGGADLLEGGPGADWLEGEGGDDRLSGGPGDDVLWGDADARTAAREAGFRARPEAPGWAGAVAGADVLEGGAGADVLHGGGGADQLDGGAGDDRLIGGPGADRYLVDGAAAGHDLVEDEGDAREPSTVIVRGVGAGALRARRAGSDLEIDFGAAGADDGFTVLDYFASPEAYHLQLADGAVIDVPGLLGIPATAGDPGAEQLMAEALAQRADQLLQSLAQSAQWNNVTGNGVDAPVDRQIWLWRVPSRPSGALVLEDPSTGETKFLFPEMPGAAAGGLRWAWDGVPLGPRSHAQARERETLGGPGADVVRNIAAQTFEVDSREARLVLDGSGTEGGAAGPWRRTVRGLDFSNVAVGTQGEELRAQVPVFEVTHWVHRVALGAGDDQFTGGPFGGAPAVVDGGDGDDLLDASRTSGAFLYGGAGDDLLRGSPQADVLAGGGGSDVLAGGAGADRYLFSAAAGGLDRIEDDGIYAGGSLVSDLLESRWLGFPLTPESPARMLSKLDAAGARLLTESLGGSERHPPQIDTAHFDVPFSAVRLGFERVGERAAIALRWGQEGDGVQVALRRPGQDPLGYGVERFEFAERTLTREELIAAVPGELPAEAREEPPQLDGSWVFLRDSLKPEAIAQLLDAMAAFAPTEPGTLPAFESPAELVKPLLLAGAFPGFDVPPQFL